MTMCGVCGTEFEGRSDAKFCSGRCRQQRLRDRGKTDAFATVGGLHAPAVSFSVTSGAFGEVGTATIELAALRGEPQRDAAGRISVELSMGGNLIWAGDCRRIERHASALTLTVAGLEARLSEQRWTVGTWEHSSVEQFVGAAAQRAGLPSLPPDEPLDARALGTYLDIAGNRSALEVLLAAARETGCDFTIRDGALAFGVPLPTEPQAVEVQNVRLTTFAAPERFRVIVRSRLPAMNGGTAQDRTLTTGCVGDISVGTPVYIITTNDRRQSDIDSLSEILAREIAGGLVHVAADIDDVTMLPGTAIRVEAAGNLLLRIVRVAHSFTAETGLQTHIEALCLPAAPAIANKLPRTLPAQVIRPWPVAA